MRSTPADSRSIATSDAEMGTRAVVFRSCKHSIPKRQHRAAVLQRLLAQAQLAGRRRNLAGIAVVGHDGGDGASRSAAEAAHHEEQFHERVVDLCRGASAKN